MVGKIWSREKIIQMIRDLYKKGEFLDMTSASRKYSTLYLASNKYFRMGWQKVVELAGIDIRDIRKQKGWSRPNIIEQLRILYQQGKSLRSYHNVRLADAARKYFGSYAKALDAAGLPYEKIGLRRPSPRESWGREKVIQTIQELHKKGEPLNQAYVTRKYPKLRGVAHFYFERSWRKAIEAAGFDYDKDIKKEYLLATVRIEKWTKDEIVNQLKLLYSEGKSLRPSLNKRLFAAAKRHFGSYEDAISATGLSYQELGIRCSKPLEKWNKKEIARELQRRFSEGMPLNAGEMRSHAKNFYDAARFYFGDYAAALKAAGIDPKSLRKARGLREWILSLTPKDMERIEEQISSLGKRKENKHEKASN
ncbi:MAG: hypothetical protein HY764_04250 [Candidatus Portnoybacteria bacterium]|nr:hypothetical protein [Candidatus Portnoybacteria bacterium]